MLNSVCSSVSNPVAQIHLSDLKDFVFRVWNSVKGFFSSLHNATAPTASWIWNAFTTNGSRFVHGLWSVISYVGLSALNCCKALVGGFATILCAVRDLAVKYFPIIKAVVVGAFVTTWTFLSSHPVHILCALTGMAAGALLTLFIERLLLNQVPQNKLTETPLITVTPSVTPTVGASSSTSNAV